MKDLLTKLVLDLEAVEGWKWQEAKESLNPSSVAERMEKIECFIISFDNT
jgi:hypothetical protein